MNTIDIIAIVILAFAAYKGFVNGLVVELCQLLSILIGGYLAYYFSSDLAPLLPVDKEYGEVVAFVIIVVGVVILIAIISRLISKLLSLTPLGFLNNLGGAVISMFKSSIVISLLVFSVIYINSFTKWIPSEVFKESITCSYAKKLNSALFPYIEYFDTYYKKIIKSLPSNESDSNQGNRELV